MLLLAALCVGVLWGALSCASGLAVGIGHAGHLRIAEPRPAEQTGPTHAHHGQESMLLSVESPGSTPDDVPTGRAPTSELLGQGHPGLACVVEFVLGFPAPSVLATVDLMSDRPLLAPPERVSEPEPPIPRCVDFV